mgnify:CR=1 FL=1
MPGGWLTDCGVFNMDEDGWMIDELMVAVAEESFKAGLDLECPVDLEELQEAIEEVKAANAF